MLTLPVFKKLENITSGRNQDSYVSLAEIVQKITIFPISVNWFLLLLNTLSQNSVWYPVIISTIASYDITNMQLFSEQYRCLFELL